MKTLFPQLTPIRQRTIGHYVSLQANFDSQAAMAGYATPGVRGFLKRYEWNKLEPSVGVYDFSELDSDLAWCAARGLKLVVMILDKSFSGPQRMLPKGMEAFEALNHGGTSADPKSPAYGGYTALRWKPEVVAAFNGLTAKLAAYDNNEAFEGIALVETSLSLDNAVTRAHGYTPELYRDSYLAVLSTADANLPRSQVFWFQNFFPGNQGYIAQIAATLKDRIVLCGPDALPNNSQLVTTVYPTYEALKGQMTMGIQMSTPGYSQVNADGTAMTPADMLAYCRDVLHSHYIFWMAPKTGWPAAAAAIAAQPLVNP